MTQGFIEVQLASAASATCWPQRWWSTESSGNSETIFNASTRPDGNRALYRENVSALP